MSTKPKPKQKSKPKPKQKSKPKPCAPNFGLPDGVEPHNHDNLTPEQVGEGWRLLAESEIRESRDADYGIQCWLYGDWDQTGWTGKATGFTYRVPADWPVNWDSPAETKPTPKTKRTKIKAEYWIIDTEELDDTPTRVTGPFRTQQEAEKRLAESCAEDWRTACGCLRSEDETPNWCHPQLIVKVVRRVVPEFKAVATLKDVKP